MHGVPLSLFAPPTAPYATAKLQPQFAVVTSVAKVADAFAPLRSFEALPLVWSRLVANHNRIRVLLSPMTDALDFPPDHPQEARLWRNEGWTARVVKNEDDAGWAVEMTKDGEPEAALVGPRTMGRDKKNPKPLDATAFSTLVKTAHEVRRRHEQHLHALLHKKVIVRSGEGEIVVTLDIVVEGESPSALLAARPTLEPDAVPLAEVRVDTSFELTVASARAWIDDGYRRPG